MTMSPDRGGIFDMLLGLVRRGLGGTRGDGRQYVSWIHDADFVRAVRLADRARRTRWGRQLCRAQPLPNAEFMRALREAAGAPFGLAGNRVDAGDRRALLRTETELILKSRRVVPAPGARERIRV